MLLKASEDCPPSVKGWCCCTFLLPRIWAIGNRNWFGLLAIIPGVSLVITIVLGLKVREWAWRNKAWSSIEEFNRIQKKWAAWGVGLWITGFAVAFAFEVGTKQIERLEQRNTQELEVAQQVNNSPLATTDGKLNAIYNQAFDRGNGKKALAQEQVAWRHGSLEQCQTADCMLQKYNERISDLAIKGLD